jgi:hypothetical protein
MSNLAKTFGKLWRRPHKDLTSSYQAWFYLSKTEEIAAESIYAIDLFGMPSEEEPLPPVHCWRGASPGNTMRAEVEWLFPGIAEGE